MDDLLKNPADTCFLFNKNSWLGKNENDIILNIFLMSIISTLFIHATIFIFPQVSDRLYIDILKKKLDVVSKFTKLEFDFDLKKTLQKSFSSDNYKKVKEKRNAKNRKIIFKKIESFRLATYILLAICTVLILAKWRICGKLMLGWSHLFIIFIMILSFSTELFIFMFVFTKYLYMPNIKMFSVILDQVVKVIKSNDILNQTDFSADLEKLKEKGLMRIHQEKEKLEASKDELIKNVKDKVTDGAQKKLQEIENKIEQKQQQLDDLNKSLQQKKEKLESKLTGSSKDKTAKETIQDESDPSPMVFDESVFCPITY